MRDHTCAHDGCDREAVVSRWCNGHYRKLTVAQRFFDGVPATEPSPDECWEWAGRIQRGYGRFWHGGQNLAAHRVSYELLVGPLPDGMVVRHACDNPPCCNPFHLQLGTMRDNSADMTARRRQYSKLTNEDVRAIRARHASGVSYLALATEFRVGRSAIRDVVCRKTWKHVA